MEVGHGPLETVQGGVGAAGGEVVVGEEGGGGGVV